MRIAAITLVAAGLFATASVAAEGVTDNQFLKANRCRGLAASGKLTPVDVSAIDAYIKEGAKLRGGYQLEKAREVQANAKREAKYQDRQARLDAELTGACMALVTGAKPTATAQNPLPAQP